MTIETGAWTLNYSSRTKHGARGDGFWSRFHEDWSGDFVPSASCGVHSALTG